jgi:hypothetical protein
LWNSRTPLATIGWSGFLGGVIGSSGFLGGVIGSSGFFDGVIGSSGFFDGVTSGFFFLEGGSEGGTEAGEGGTEAGEGGTEAGATIVGSKDGGKIGAGLLSFFLIKKFSISGHMRNTPKMTRTHDIIAAKITGRIIVYIYSIFYQYDGLTCTCNG